MGRLPALHVVKYSESRRPGALGLSHEQEALSHLCAAKIHAGQRVLHCLGAAGLEPVVQFHDQRASPCEPASASLVLEKLFLRSLDI